MSGQFPVKLNITRIERHSPRIWSFFMKPQNARANFIAGQVAVLGMDDYKPAYVAFASAPEDNEYEFLIKRSQAQNVTEGLFDPQSARHVSLKEVVGRGFPVEEHKGHDLVFVAMGTGLAPLRSALRHIFHAREDYGRLVVLYGARTLEDFCFEEEMTTDWRAHGVELRQVISQPDSDWSGPTGYVQSLLDNIVHTLPEPLALVCGSPEMMAQTKIRLAELGFAPEKILTNY